MTRRPIAFLFVFLGGAAGAAPARDATGGKVAPWVLEKTAGGAAAEFFVVLSRQADLSGAGEIRGKTEKGAFVRDALAGVAEASQRPILALLASRGVEARPFHIVNAVLVKGTRALALELASRPDVLRVEGNPVIRNRLETPERPRGDTSETPAAIGSNITYTHADQVWALGFTGQGIVVGGQDTGIQWDHPALKPQYRGWNSMTMTASHDYNWHDSIHSGGGTCGPSSASPCDDYDHGTHTMGTVVGDDGGANQIGMAPGAKWIGCRNMDQGSGTPATYMECLQFFLAPYPVAGTPAQGDPSRAPDVTNNSWSCPTFEGCSALTLQAALDAQRAAGILTVAAAQNGGPGCSTVSDPPAIHASVFDVGALSTGTDTIASFSSRGPVTADGSNRMKPDISAPGTSIRSSVRGSTYTTLSGTSMASPHVAGAVALLWSAQPALKHNIDLTLTILGNSAVHIGANACSSSGSPNNVYGHGRLDVKAAVDFALTTCTSPSVTAPADFTITQTICAP